jgi:hypothetical protein
MLNKKREIRTREKNMKRTIPVAASVLLFASLTSAEDSRLAPATGLTRLRSLAGAWEGHIMTKDGPTATVTYAVTAGGNAVEEKLFAGEEYEMTSMYYIEGDELRVTHYCHAGNRPVMRLNADRSTPGRLVFDFVSVGGTKSPDEQHIHHAVLEIGDDEVRNGPTTRDRRRGSS